jgi:glutamyl-tRNA reductase
MFTNPLKSGTGLKIFSKMITHKHYNIREIHNAEYFRKQLLLQIPGPKVIIQTCMRLELYYGFGEINAATARHLFRLVCGLDSVFVGDTSVKSQVKKAYCESSRKYLLPKEMHRLFQTSLRVGKLVHSATSISIGAVSYPQAVIGIIKTRYPDLKNLTISVVGINDITRKLFKWFVQTGVTKLNIVNRTPMNAEKITEYPDIGVFQLDQLPRIIDTSDIMILCTSAPGYLIGRQDIRAGRKCCIIDLSWPRNSDPAIIESGEIQLFALQDIEDTIHQNLDIRKESIEMANLIIEYELDKLFNWQANQRSDHFEWIAEPMKE